MIQRSHRKAMLTMRNERELLMTRTEIEKLKR